MIHAICADYIINITCPLKVLESAVKNCGSLIHDEIGTRSYMEQMQELVKSSPHENVRNKCLELLQVWAHAFRNSAKYRPVQVKIPILGFRWSCCVDFSFDICEASVN
jgi:VHS domain